MKATRFVIVLILLAFEVADASPPMAAAKEPGMVQGLERLLVRNGDIIRTSDGVPDIGTASTSLVGEKCVTFEHCRKKKWACAKECGSKQRGGRIDTTHFPGKCFLKCKRCIPTC